ncbi:hypothetical protein JIN84_04900 [Luteolibacter yonseiensis]|uniref:Uncharacterized protein n=1 Tax=Luteolibacter yonseiensis TaxID=1144680 RepID=A0A934VAK0_9BACT|nr:hypothetical protein [Luteolibacter yonseiensis]MBK1814941.1 hypothetical protein [Luteolibacter yonseiensis]
MKSITHLLAAAIAVTTAFISAPKAEATPVVLRGAGYYKIANKIKYYVNVPSQSGRFRHLGEGYYQKTTYGFDYIVNRGNKRSGDLSFEFWAMPYFGATSGEILMTRGRDPLKAGKSYRDADSTGQAVNIDERAFPEINLWEYNGRNWVNRDAFTFSRSTRL